MCFDIITIKIRVSIRVLGLHLVFWGQTHFTHSICHFEAEFAVVDKKNHSAGAQAREGGPL